MNEIEQIQQAGVSPDALAYFQRNPDVAQAYNTASYGMSPEEFARTHYERYGQQEQRIWDAPTAQNLTQMDPAQQQDYLSRVYANIGTPSQEVTPAAGESPATLGDWQSGGLRVLGTNNENYVDPASGNFRAMLTQPFDQPGEGGQYGTYIGEYNPEGQLQNVNWTPVERHSGWLAEHPEAVMALALAGAGALIAPAAAGASLGEMAIAPEVIGGAAESAVQGGLAAASDVATQQAVASLANASPQSLQALAQGSIGSTSASGLNQAMQFTSNLWENIGATILPDAPVPVQRAVGEVAVRTAATGGDIERALTDTGIGFVTGGIGSQVGDITGSQLAGRAAADAARQIAATGTYNPLQFGVNEASRFLGSEASRVTDSPLVGNMLGGAARDILSGRDPTAGLVSTGANALFNTATSGLDRFLPTGGLGSVSDRGEGVLSGLGSAARGTLPSNVLGDPTVQRGIGLRDVASAYLGASQGTQRPANTMVPPRVDVSTLQRIPLSQAQEIIRTSQAPNRATSLSDIIESMSA